MKFSESWLREWVNPELSTDKLVAQLTMAGLEVDAVENVSEALGGVIVGEILSAEQHPDADKLRLCKVAGHPDGEQQVVCGAPNARPGIKIPFATVGAELPGNFKIKKAKLRGVESFGMLCAQTELQLGDDDDGLWELPADAPVGQSLTEYLQLNDKIIEVDLTPNRSDCLGIRGLAREVATLNELEFRDLTVQAVAAKTDATFNVSLKAGEACTAYAGRVIKNVDVSQPTPLWMVEKLRRSGVRSIDPVVDVTNYVLLELGQPMHAFDLEKLSDSIQVRMAKDGEKLVLLDGQEIQLKSDTLIIADAKGPLAIAGVMGGEASAVTSTTKNIFLESAFFHPAAIAGKARAYGLHTDSSHRFERGVDWDLQAKAIERATELLLAITGGESGPVVEVSLPQKPQGGEVVLSKSRLASALGVALNDEVVSGILTRLGLELLDGSDDQWQFKIPSYRFDISIEADLVEEVARVYGYDKLPTKALTLAPELESHSEANVSLPKIKQHLVSLDYQEAVTYSFIDPALHDILFPGQTAVQLKNPISADMASMRTSLIPGLVQALKHNLNRQQPRVRFFESGLSFVSKDGSLENLKQSPAIAGLIYGGAQGANWFGDKRDVDFFDLKGDVESLLAFSIAGKEYSFSACDDLDYMHPGQSARVSIGGKVVGVVGCLHPIVAKKLELDKSCWVFELQLEPLLKGALPHFEPLSKFPEVSRDMAILVNTEVGYADIESEILSSAGKSLKRLKIFDVYRGENLPEGKQSLAFSLTFQDKDKTLKDEEIHAAMDSVVKQLQKVFGAELR